MRNIVFRGKRADTGEWLYGDLIHVGYLLGIVEVVEEISKMFVSGYVVFPETIGQLTGLKDKNGTDIWEGDLLRTPEGDIMVVEWQNTKMITRCVRPADSRYINDLQFAYPVSEAIGNIHDNPELLEGEGL